VYKDRFLNLNLGELSFWRKDEDNAGMVKPDQMQRRLYVTATQIAVNGVEMVPATPNTVPEVTTEDTPVETPEIRAERDEDEVDEITAVINDAIGVKVLEPTELDIADIDASDLDSINNEIAEFENIKIDEDENFEVVVKQTEEIEEEDSEKPLTLEESVLKACDSFIEAGMLTTKEYQRITEQASNYRKIENPFGEGLLVDMLEVNIPASMKLSQAFSTDYSKVRGRSLSSSSISSVCFTTTSKFSSSSILMFSNSAISLLMESRSDASISAISNSVGSNTLTPIASLITAVISSTSSSSRSARISGVSTGVSSVVTSGTVLGVAGTISTPFTAI
jgi:hypothetical protein